jgi:hypothetical protein
MCVRMCVFIFFIHAYIHILFFGTLKTHSQAKFHPYTYTHTHVKFYIAAEQKSIILFDYSLVFIQLYTTQHITQNSCDCSV